MNKKKTYKYDLLVLVHNKGVSDIITEVEDLDTYVRMVVQAPTREDACRHIIHEMNGVFVRYIDIYYPLLHEHLIDEDLSGSDKY